jgi:hypothetical protein
MIVYSCDAIQYWKSAGNVFLLWQKRILRFAFPVGSEELRRGNGAMRFSVRSFGYALFYYIK